MENKIININIKAFLENSMKNTTSYMITMIE